MKANKKEFEIAANPLLPKNILILNPNPSKAFDLGEICRETGRVHYAPDLNDVIPTLKTLDFNVLVVDSSLAHYQYLKGIFKKITSIVVTGEDEDKVREIIRQWPGNRYLDLFTYSRISQNHNHFKRIVDKAMSHSQLMSQLENMRFSLYENNVHVEETVREINKIKFHLEKATVREMEKRIRMQAEFSSFRREKNQIERILKKLYKANDVTSLLDSILDIKRLIDAGGITMYIMDKNEMTGAYLKPLVWEGSFVSHPEKDKHIMTVDSSNLVVQAAKEQREFGQKNLLVVPLIYQKKTIGVLEVKKDRFSESDKNFLRRISEHISIAVNKLNLIQYDALTGLLRPEPFYDKVIHKLRIESKRHQEPGSFAMVMGDVDWFKNYNDRNGHEAGNRLLRALGNILKSSARDEDLICRYGGEEFLFFLSGIKNEKEALVITDRIRKNVEEYYFENQEYQPRNNLTMCFGITYFPHRHFFPPQDIDRKFLKKLINEADLALAEAKGKRDTKPGASEVPNKNTLLLYKKSRVAKNEPAASESFPENRKPEKRKYKRYYTSLPLVFKSSSHKEKGHEVMKTINISMGGAKISSRNPLPANNVRDIIVLIGDKAFECKAEVVYTQRGGNNFPFYYAGLKFTEVSMENKKALHKYFMSLS